MVGKTRGTTTAHSSAAGKAGEAKAPRATKSTTLKATQAAPSTQAAQRAATAVGAPAGAGVPVPASAQHAAGGHSVFAARLSDPKKSTIARDAAELAAALPKMLCDLGGVQDVGDLGVRPLVASAGEGSLFNCLFGRDSIRMARDLIEGYPKVAQATVKALAQLQGTKTAWKAEEEPGRIIHEFRSPEEMKSMMAFNTIIQNWDFPYYGSVDSTPMFVSLVAALAQKSGPGVLDVRVNNDDASKARFGDSERTVKHAVQDAVKWIEGRLDDPRAGGFLYVQRQNPKGIGNQILEDSGDSVYFDNGKKHPVELPYAPIAEQGYAYAALKDAAKLLGDPALAARAEDLKQRVVRDFWQDDLGTFAQAIGYDEKGEGTPMRTIASSAGQLLTSGLLDEGMVTLKDGRQVDVADLRARLIDRLFQPDMLAGAGIRTKSTTAARFRAGGYHNGTVWPTISLEVKDGVLRYAQRAQAEADKALASGNGRTAAAKTKEAGDLFAKVVDLEDRAIKSCAQFPFFPEFFRGDVDGSIAVNTEIVRGLDQDGEQNTFEQPPQPQGWTTTGIEKVLRRRGLLGKQAKAS